MSNIRLGNIAICERLREDKLGDDGELIESVERWYSYEGQSTTTYPVIPGWSLSELLHNLSGANGAWRYHSTEPPAWIECEDPFMAEAVSREFDCPIGCPQDWENRVGKRTELVGYGIEQYPLSAVDQAAPTDSEPEDVQP